MRASGEIMDILTIHQCYTVQVKLDMLIQAHRVLSTRLNSNSWHAYLGAHIV